MPAGAALTQVRRTSVLLAAGAVALSCPGPAHAQLTVTPPTHIAETGEADPEVANYSSERPTARDRNTADVPKLVRRADGRHAYKGRGFDATILGDGTVVMRDVFVRARFTFQSRRYADNEWRMTFWETKFDLTGWLMKKFGDDPNRSERRWFLEGTRDLRERLATQSAVDAMRATLTAVWSRAGVSFSERKRLTFALWDDTSDDEQGQIGRGIVESFVRERCPRDSALGYGDDELQTLNAARKSRTEFAPYLADAPGNASHGDPQRDR